MQLFDTIIKLSDCLRGHKLSQTIVKQVPNIKSKDDAVSIQFSDYTPITSTSATNVCRILFNNRGINKETFQWELLSLQQLGVVEYKLRNLHHVLAIKNLEKRIDSLTNFLKSLELDNEETKRTQYDSATKCLFDASDAALYAILTDLTLSKEVDQLLVTLSDLSQATHKSYNQTGAVNPEKSSDILSKLSFLKKKKDHMFTSNSFLNNKLLIASTAAINIETKAGFPVTTNFIRQIIEEDLASKKHSEIVTRFPPEPNGRLHLGHAKSICLNFGLAKEFNGHCNLRFDDTNPEKEEQQFIEFIQEDVRWLGGDWKGHLYYASDYFQTLFDWAVQLINQGDAYVDDQTEEEVRANRGDLLHPGNNSIFRERSVEENLDLFYRMKNGEFAEGSRILRAKIDMSHGNMNMRDPPIYRIKLNSHPRTQNKWKVYPFYDFAHGQSDSIEKITHSICTLEFEDHRPLYEWFQEKLNIFRTRQIEFARLNCTHVVMSKRKLMTLVERKFVEGWDDPRLPTLSGLRRRGVPPEAIQDFCGRIGVAKRDIVVKYELLESCIIQELNPVALRRNVVLRPLLVHITNLEDKHIITLNVFNHPEDKALGTRKMHFCNILYIDEEDFSIDPLPGYTRLTLDGEVRLRYGFWIKCHKYNIDSKTGKISELFCTYDPEIKDESNSTTKERKNRSIIHWVSSYDAIDFTVNMFDHLLTEPVSNETCSEETNNDHWERNLNPKSLQKYTAKGEACLKDSKHPYIDKKHGTYLQFERLGFFVPDYASKPENPVFNLTVLLHDSWAAKANQASVIAQRKTNERIAREKAAAAREEKRKQKLERNLEKNA